MLTSGAFLTVWTAPLNETYPDMDRTLAFRIEAAKLTMIDTLAGSRGGRGPFMRQLVDAVLRQSGATCDEREPSAEAKQGAQKRLPRLSLTDTEMIVLRHQAEARRMTPTTWATVLVRRRLGIAAPVDRELREELLNCRQALQRIGRNVNQLARAANRMALADNAAEIGEELRKVNELRAAIGAAVDGIGAATKADLSYWEIPGERL